jgi:rhodanese-related sulfurtransferase
MNNVYVRYAINLAVYAVLGFALFAATGLIGGKDPTRVALTIGVVAIWSASLTTVLERYGYTKRDAKERVAWGAVLGALSVGGFTGGLSWLAWDRVDLVLVPIGALLGGAMQGARAFAIGSRLSDAGDGGDGDDDEEGGDAGANEPAKGAAMSEKDEARALAKTGALVIDVRRKPEWDAGHLENAKLVPLDELPSRLAEIEQWLGGDKAKPVVVHCQSGGRSARAKVLLEQNGFSRVLNGISPSHLK